jgi:hypothetical protein
VTVGPLDGKSPRFKSVENVIFFVLKNVLGALHCAYTKGLRMMVSIRSALRRSLAVNSFSTTPYSQCR